MLVILVKQVWVFTWDYGGSVNSFVGDYIW
jgi:hypothetical protein